MQNSTEATHRRAAGNDIWTLLSISFLLAGLAIRTALYFPLAMFQIDSDAVISGLCAFRVAAGEYPVFLPGGTRVGAASCYVAAGYFHLFGPGRIGLALTGLTWGAMYLLFTLLFLRAVLGPKTSLVAFLFAAAPSEQFMTVTYPPWGYGEIMASCAATLWLAAIWRRDGKLLQRLCFGFSVGLGLWFSLQTLMIALPAIVWIGMKRKGNFMRESFAAIPGVILGAAPFLIENGAHGFLSFTQNFYSRPVSSVPQALANLTWLLTYLLPKLLFQFPRWPVWFTLLLAFGLVAIGFAVAFRQAAGDSHDKNVLDAAVTLLVLVLIACVLIFSFSQAGTIRGWTVRYIAPLYVIVPLFCGIGIAGLWRCSRWLAVASVAALLVPNLFSYGLPGSSLRAELTNQLADDRQLRDVLARNCIQVVYGDYLWVYHLNFDSGESIAGVPSYAPYDYYDYGGRLGESAVRWAALGNLEEVLGWARALRANGSPIKIGGLWVFIAKHPAASAAHLLSALRAARS